VIRVLKKNNIIRVYINSPEVNIFDIKKIIRTINTMTTLVKKYSIIIELENVKYNNDLLKYYDKIYIKTNLPITIILTKK
jgi:hypothetical protein